MMIKKILCTIFALIMLFSTFVSCGNDEEATLISFSQAASINELKELAGKQVAIIGYMSSQTPVSGKFMYLMNMPYQSCPFCVPNTNQLSNTIAVYAKSGKEFDFTDRAIMVTGTLVFGNFVDEFNYSYYYKIENATYDVIDTSQLNGNILLWQQLASTDVITDVNSMFDYLYLLSCWDRYLNIDGSDYYSPEEVLSESKSDEYFDNLIAKIKDVDETAFTDLIQIIENGKSYAKQAISEIENENYQYINEYCVNEDGNPYFGDGRKQYKLNNSKKLMDDFYKVYDVFSAWLANWEI